MTFVVHSCFKKTIRKETKSSQDLLKQGGPSRDEDGQGESFNESETIDGFCPQGDVCQSGLGLERLVFQHCHGKHPLDV